MKHAEQREGQQICRVNIAEFTHYFRLIHQLAAMKNRTKAEDNVMRTALKKTTRMMHHIQPGMDKQTDKLIGYAFSYYMEKREEAAAGNSVAEKLVHELKPLYHMQLVAMTYRN